MQIRDRVKRLVDSKIGWVGTVSFFAVAAFFVISLLAGIITIPFYIIQKDEDLLNVVVSLVAPVLMILGVVLFAKLFFKQPIKEVLKLKVPNKKVWWMVPAVVGGYVVLLVMFFMILYVISPKILEQQQDVAAALEKIRGLKLFIMAFGVAFLTPIAEELFFRSFLLSLYAKKVQFLVGIFAGAALFGLAHWQLNVSVDTFLFGIALGLLTWQTESIYPAIALHMLKNGLALTSILK